MELMIVEQVANGLESKGVERPRMHLGCDGRNDNTQQDIGLLKEAKDSTSTESMEKAMPDEMSWSSQGRGGNTQQEQNKINSNTNWTDNELKLKGGTNERKRTLKLRKEIRLMA